MFPDKPGQIIGVVLAVSINSYGSIKAPFNRHAEQDLQGMSLATVFIYSDYFSACF